MNPSWHQSAPIVNMTWQHEQHYVLSCVHFLLLVLNVCSFLSEFGRIALGMHDRATNPTFLSMLPPGLDAEKLCAPYRGLVISSG
jgi:choline-glycine betaine transporter